VLLWLSSVCWVIKLNTPKWYILATGVAVYLKASLESLNYKHTKVPTTVNVSPANQRTLYTASLAVDAPSSTSERPVELCMNVSANTFGAFKKTRVVSPAVAEHFNSPGHSLSDIVIRGLRRCSGASFRRKQFEMQLIFGLGTMQPGGMNNVFHSL